MKKGGGMVYEIENIIKIFDKYPLLTINKRAQLLFLKTNLIKNDINWYLNNRNLSPPQPMVGGEGRFY